MEKLIAESYFPLNSFISDAYRAFKDTEVMKKFSQQ